MNREDPAAAKKRALGERRKFPCYVPVLFGIAAFALVLEILNICSSRFADGFNTTVGAFFRTVLAHMTSFLPFSLAEFLLYLVPFLIALIAVIAYRRHSESWRELGRYFVCILSFFSIFFSLFVFSFGAGYRTTPLPEKMGFETGEVGVEELTETTKFFIEKMNTAADGVSFGEDGFAVMPYSLAEMNEKLLSAYDTVCTNYPFIQRMNSRVKPVLASKLMSSTHITGVYSYYTGEANLNTYFPDYTLPFTAAHELAHQRGIAREEEANFVAFLVTSASDDPYLQYSAWRNLFEYVASALAMADANAYRELYATIDTRIVAELRAYREFFKPFSGSAASAVSDKFNDTYLKFHGSEAGSGSYGLVVDLAVAYFKK